MTITDHPAPDLSGVDASARPLPVPPPLVGTASPPGAVPAAGRVRGARTARLDPRRWTVHGWLTAAIAVMTTALYTWNLSANELGNDYYAAAVKSASVDWKAFFFGSIDPGNFITVDKPPVALWVQALSARLFGFSSWSILLPEAIAGVASVLILHNLVRRWQGDVAAHLAALAFALTPVAALMFRFNNPDAILTLLSLGAAWALWKALESGLTRWLVLSGVLVGFAFNAKMLQAFVVLPAFVLVYLWAGKPRLRRRIGQLTAALAAVVVSSSWWVAIVTLWPAADRPYIGGSETNSVIELLVGYNGLARIFGGEGGGQGGNAIAAMPGGGGSMFGGTVGWTRMFNSVNGGQIAWLLPLAAVGLLAGLWLTRKAPRIDLGRAGWLLWGGWTLVIFTVFSRAQGIFHPYYSVQLAPGVAALAGAGGVALWRLGRRHRWMQWLLPATIVVTAGVALMLLDRTPTYVPWLRTAIMVGAVLAVLGIFVGSLLRHKTLVGVAAVVATATLLAGPAAYTLTTVATSARGSVVSAGPSTGAGMGAQMGAGGLGGGASTTDAALITYLQAHRGDATYLVATFGSQSSAAIIIATGEPVITIGGFGGSDPAPTLEQFQALVASGQVRYLLVSGNGGGFPGGGGTTSAITSWATQVGTAVDASVSGTSTGTLYDLAGTS